MELDEVIITRAIFDEYSKSFLDYIDIDVALVGGGPANLVAAKYLAEKGVKVAIYEKKICLGNGMWTGGMMFIPRIVVQEEARCTWMTLELDIKNTNQGIMWQTQLNLLEANCRCNFSRG